MIFLKKILGILTIFFIGHYIFNNILLLIFFRADLPERKKRFPSWAGAEKCAVDLNFGEKTGILVATGPGPREIEVTSLHFVL